MTMRILGLTGSIGMGKSTAASMLRRLGVPVHDADAEVHRLLSPGGRGAARVLEVFPDVGDGRGGVDRNRLGARVFGDAAALRRLEGILHPLVQVSAHAFLLRNALAGRPVVVLEVPLLFEGGRDRFCDAVIVVSAPAFLQRQRVLARPGMTGEKLAGVLARQMPDHEKRRRADVVLPTGLGRAETLRRLEAFLRVVEEEPAEAWARWVVPAFRPDRPRHRVPTPAALTRR